MDCVFMYMREGTRAGHSVFLVQASLERLAKPKKGGGRAMWEARHRPMRVPAWPPLSRAQGASSPEGSQLAAHALAGQVAAGRRSGGRRQGERRAWHGSTG